MIEGLIDSITADAVVQGWARDTRHQDACHVRVLFGTEPVAEAMADQFRRDLLRQGHGHGHYGFAARLHRALPEGVCTLSLHLPALGAASTMAVTAPQMSARAAARIEDLLEEAPGWTAADLRGHPTCINASGNLQRLGTERFIDAVYSFVFGRWPTQAETRLHAANLDRHRITAEDLLIDLLQSQECLDAGGQLASPFDPGFPFILEQPTNR